MSTLRKTRGLLAHTSSNYEDTLGKVKVMGYLAKPAMLAKETALKHLGSRPNCQH